MSRGLSVIDLTHSSLLKKGSDPLRPFVFPMFQHGLQRVRPLFQQADSGAVLVCAHLLNRRYWCPRGFRKLEAAEGTAR